MDVSYAEGVVIVYLQHWYIYLAYGGVIDFKPSSSVVDAGHLDECHTELDEVVKDSIFPIYQTGYFLVCWMTRRTLQFY